MAQPRRVKPQPTQLGVPSPTRSIYCNRTLNLRSIRAIGYDMDYTLVHYRAEEWEKRAYDYVKDKLVEQGWPIQDLTFDPDIVGRGLIIDRELGNVLKANRFGYVKQAVHGTTPIDFEIQRRLYGRTIIALGEGRFEFLNTLFSISEAGIYAQLVMLLDQRRLPEVLSYNELYRIVRSAVDDAHIEGLLKAEIIENPDKFVELDPEVPLTLLDQRNAGKKLVLITNSEWHYSQAMMAYAFDRFLPNGTSWSDLFDLVIVSARKPAFFMNSAPMFRVIDDQGRLEPLIRGPTAPGIYLGGDATTVEQYLGLSGDQILYVGDHIFSDVKVSKSILRWRTALILRELEGEVSAATDFRDQQAELNVIMEQKEALELEYHQLRLLTQRAQLQYGPQPTDAVSTIEKRIAHLKVELNRLDERASTLATAAGELRDKRWGPILRAGNDKSHMARQVERYADIYTSRVSNFLTATPFAYFRSPRGSLPHDP